MTLTKSTVDVCSWCVIFATIMHWLPEIAAGFSILWGIIQGLFWLFDDGPQKLRDKFRAWKQRHWGKKE